MMFNIIIKNIINMRFFNCILIYMNFHFNFIQILQIFSSYINFLILLIIHILIKYYNI